MVHIYLMVGGREQLYTVQESLYDTPTIKEIVERIQKKIPNVKFTNTIVI